MGGWRMTATRVTAGAISLSSSIHFPLMPYSNRVNPVKLPPGRARLSTKPAPTGSATCTNTIGMVWVASSIACTPAGVDPHVAAVGPAQLLQPLRERCDAGLPLQIVRGEWHEHADVPHALALLRAGRERPRGRRTAEQRDELAPPHVLPQAEGHTLPPVIGTVLCITANFGRR